MSENLKAVLRRNLRAALRQGDLGQAASLLAHLKEEEPLALETRGLELEYLIDAERWGEAATLAAQLLELFPASARVHYLAGRLAYRRRDYETAEGHFRESHHLHASGWTEYFLGKTLTQLGRYDEAEAILLRRLEEQPRARLDLSWLYERRGQCRRALEEVDAFLREHPGDAYALEQRSRLRAAVSEPEELIGEVEGLAALGEEASPGLVPRYIESLLTTGRGDEAREWVRERRGRLEPWCASRAGWVCYRLQAHDLAMDLFLEAFEENKGRVKYLSALEAAARRTGRLEELTKLYAERAGEEKRLYGRLRGLRRG